MRCSAKAKSTGEQCRRHAKAGFNVCRVHGANEQNPGGAPVGNANAVKHGAYETLMRERLPEEQRGEFDVVSVEPSLEAELRILRFKLFRLVGEVTQNVHGKDGTWTVTADDFEKARGIALIAGEIRKMVKDMKDVGGQDDPLAALVADWEAGMRSEGKLDAAGSQPETT